MDKTIKILALVSAVVLVGALIYRIIQSQSGSSEAPTGKFTEIRWRDLVELDYKTGDMPDSLRKLNDTRIKIPGFAVPLDESIRTIEKFLFVPNGMACIHVPPPPPNQMIMVTMQKEVPLRQILGPLWLVGQFKITETESKYGSSSFEMVGETVEPYR